MEKEQHFNEDEVRKMYELMMMTRPYDFPFKKLPPKKNKNVIEKAGELADSMIFDPLNFIPIPAFGLLKLKHIVKMDKPMKKFLGKMENLRVKLWDKALEEVRGGKEVEIDGITALKRNIISILEKKGFNLADAEKIAEKTPKKIEFIKKPEVLLHEFLHQKYPNLKEDQISFLERQIEHLSKVKGYYAKRGYKIDEEIENRMKRQNFSPDIIETLKNDTNHLIKIYEDADAFFKKIGKKSE